MKKINKYYAVMMLAVASTLALSGHALAAATKVDLGTADSFTVLAATNITNVPTSAVIGNVGLSPSTGAGIGLTQAQVTGTIYSVDAFGPSGAVNNPALLTTAKNDLTSAYTNAANETPTSVVPTELGSTTKLPGIYTSGAGDFQITGTLTLNAQGDPNAIFIFQMASTLTTAANSIVTLINGAQACNVFWQIGSSIGNIGTNSTFKGNVLALTSLNVNTGANVEGRILARNGAVTLASDTITRPTCVVAPASAATSTTTSAVPTLPNTGIAPKYKRGVSESIVIPSALVIVLGLLYFVRKKRTI